MGYLPAMTGIETLCLRVTHGFTLCHPLAMMETLLRAQVAAQQNYLPVMTGGLVTLTHGVGACGRATCRDDGWIRNASDMLATCRDDGCDGNPSYKALVSQSLRGRATLPVMMGVWIVHMSNIDRRLATCRDGVDVHRW